MYKTIPGGVDGRQRQRSSDCFRCRLPLTTLSIVFVVVTCHRLLSGSSSSPPTIDYSLDTLCCRLLLSRSSSPLLTIHYSMDRLFSPLPAINYSLDHRPSFCAWIRHRTGTEQKRQRTPNLAHGTLRNEMCNSQVL